MDEEKSDSLKDAVKKLVDNQQELIEALKEGKVKKGSFPFFKRVGTKKAKKGWCLIMDVGENNSLNLLKAPIDEGVIDINGVPHPVSPEEILIYKRKMPVIIQPRWSERPYSAKRDYMENSEKSMGWKYIINHLYKNQIKQKASMKMGLIIIGILIAVGLGYYLIKSGNLF